MGVRSGPPRWRAAPQALATGAGVWRRGLGGHLGEAEATGSLDGPRLARAWSYRVDSGVRVRTAVTTSLMAVTVKADPAGSWRNAM